MKWDESKKWAGGGANLSHGYIALIDGSMANTVDADRSYD
jgi:hypothetical protein